MVEAYNKAQNNLAQDNKTEETKKQIMTRKRLMELELPVFMNINNDKLELTVYANGMVIYSDLSDKESPHHTVFSILDAKLFIDPDQHDFSYYKINDYPEFLDCDAADLLILLGQDRIDHNASSRSRYHSPLYLDNNGDYYEVASDTVHRQKTYVCEDFSDSILDREAEKQLLKDLAELRQELTKIQAQVIDLYFDKQMSKAEIARTLGKSYSTVRDCFKSAMGKLEKLKLNY